MRLKLILVVMMCFGTFYSQAHTTNLSEQDIAYHLQSFLPIKGDIKRLQTIDAIEARLNQFNENDRRYVAYLWTTQLQALREISDGQKSWLENLVVSGTQVRGYSLDHPEKSIPLIDVSQTAKATLYLNKIKVKKVRLETLWQNGMVEWTHWLQTSNENYPTLIEWLKSLNTEQAQQVTAQWLEHNLLEQLPTNQGAKLLLQKSYSLELFNFLVQRPVDEFTYQYFQQLPDYENANAITLLGRVIGHAELSSMALFSLASHYSYDLSAQRFLLSALEHPNQRWHAAMVLNKVEDELFLQTVRTKYQNYESSFAKSVVNMLNRENE